MALELFDESRSLLRALDEDGVAYALAGAVALAVHGAVRATTDIDLLVQPAALEAALRTARRCGFTVAALPMRFADGMEVRRLTKLDEDGDALTVDFLLVDENLRSVWESRIEVATEFGSVWVVSREGLIQMKIWAGRDQDLADVRRLQELDR